MTIEDWHANFEDQLFSLKKLKMQGAPAVAGSVLLDVFSIDSSYLVYWQRIRLTNQAVPGKNIRAMLTCLGQVSTSD